jgi:hypothetical protein
MTVAAMKTNLDEVQDAEMAISSVDKGDNQKKRLRRMNDEEVRIFVYPQSGDRIIQR